MASSDIEPAKPKKSRQNFISALVSAFLEWFLIVFLFVDALISFVITRFARGCKLQTPCLLCSRLDHVLGKEKMGFYWGLMCKNHKSEVSSLVLCHAHDKLVDVREMCENCLFSFATINKSNAETYRLLVGKLGEDLSSDVNQDPCLNGDRSVGLFTQKKCSCCNQPWIPRAHTHAKELLQTRFDASEAALSESPVLSHSIEHDHEVTNSVRDKSVSIMDRKNVLVDPLSHIGYTELKIHSDTESEALHSDDEYVASSSTRVVIRERDYHKHEPRIVSLVDDFASEKLLDSARDPKPSTVESHEEDKEEKIELGECKPQESVDAIGHGLEELNWHEVGNKAESDAIPVETTLHSSSPSDEIESPVEALENSSNVTKASEAEETPVAESEIEEVSQRETPSETCLETSAVAGDNARQTTNSLELGDAYKLAVDNRGKQLSGSLADHWLGKDSSRVTEDLKVLLSQLSSKGGFDLPISPKVSINSDDHKALEPSSSVGMQILQKRFSLERNESGLSLDGSIISEIEGESAVDRLKRQVDHDKKLMAALYKELEEERNASAVATNQAMAMITRLQEEKAALHMEALQYLRMMEEQAEYDDDELQKSNDLLADKEKELQDLEAELEYYKKKFPNERYLENLSETSGDIRITDIGVDCVPISKNVDEVNSDSPIVVFEDEKAYIVQCVKKLERTLDLISDEKEIANLSKEDETSASGQGFYEEETEESHLTDLDSIRTTVSRLNKRLEALEEDRRLLEHTMNSVSNGDEGVRFVQDIASHLQELRKIATQKDQIVV